MLIYYYISLKRVLYIIKTEITKKNLEKLLIMCTQGTPFTFNDKMYMQIDGVMMGSPLGALFANIFMCELENTIIPKLGDKICHWKRYVDDTFAFIKPNTEKEIQQSLNSFHENIQFTYEREQANQISFLDVLITRKKDGSMQTSVYRKPTHTDVYLNWNAHAPNIWKTATVRSLVKRAFTICSNDTSLNAELNHLTNVFTKYNEYPMKVIKNIIQNEKNKSTTVEPNINPTTTPTIVTLSLPYAGQKGESIINKMRKTINNVILNNNNTKVQTIYNTKKLGSKFTIKDQVKEQHQHNLVYHAKCPDSQCDSNYIGQTKCRLLKRVIQHNKTDKKSHLLIHANNANHHRVWLDDFEIIGKGYNSNFKRHISEALFIKDKKPNLNVQKDAYRLNLYN